MTDPQTEARAIFTGLAVAFGSDAEREEVTRRIATALAAKDAKLAAVKAELFQSRNFWSDELSKISAKLAEAKAEVARYWTSADMKSWCDLAEEKGLGHFGKKLRGMFSRAIKAEDDARAEHERAERAEAQLAALIAADEQRVRDISRLTIERDEARAQLAEAHKALEQIASFPRNPRLNSRENRDHALIEIERIARRAREAQGGE